MDCRYCFEPCVEPRRGGERNWVRPCDCKSAVHRKCLEQWNEARGEVLGNAAATCEICNSRFATAQVAKFDRSKCCSDIAWTLYYIFALPVFFTCEVVIMFGYSLVGAGGTAMLIAVILVPVASLVIIGGVCCCVVCDQDPKNTVYVCHVLYIMSGVIIVTQGLSLFIANPILGRPIAFTPTFATFGVMFGIEVVAFTVATIVCAIVMYGQNHWVHTENVIVDKEVVDASEKVPDLVV